MGNFGKRFFLAVLSGLLLAPAFPRWDISLLAWIALVPLLWACGGGKVRRAFALGWVSGMVFYLATLYWVVYTMATYTNLSPAISVGPLLLMCAVLSLYTGAFTAGIRWCEKRGRIHLGLSAPFLWVGLEWLRSFFFIGFPWVSLGYSQYRHHSLIQFAEFTGIYGVSALVICANAVMCSALKRGIKGQWHILSLLACMIASLALWGQWRVGYLDRLPPHHHLRVGLIQGNIEQDRKWDVEYQEATIARYEELTMEALGEGAQLVVWPETAVPFYFQAGGHYRERLLRFCRATGIYLLFGSPAFQYDGPELHLFNRAYLVAPQGEVAGYYDKLQLVPFGEYIPFRPLLFFVEKLVEGMGDFFPGHEATVFSLPQGNFGVLICYEGIFPALTRRFVARGADFLVNITNDAWFGRTSAPHQHLAMVTVRAIENRVPVVRVANTGFSAVIDISGRIYDRTALFEMAYRVENIAWPEVSTFYTRFGDLFAFVCAVVSATMMLYAIVKGLGTIPKEELC